MRVSSVGRLAVTLALASSALWVACGDDASDGPPGTGTGTGGGTQPTSTGTSGAGGGASTCADGELSPGESDVDCGGPCPACTAGSQCSSGSDCAGGFCTDGVCCDEACDGTCEACNIDGSVGSCQPVPAGNDPGQECAQGDSAETCDGAGQCHCGNGVQDLDERAVDCGGAGCDSCWHYLAGDGVGGIELWRSDGTAAGTALVKDINPSGDSQPRHFRRLGGVVYFSADDGSSGRELWRTDGTDAGTHRVEDIVSGPTSSNPHALTTVAGVLFFKAGQQLWRSDGTESGTVLVREFTSLFDMAGHDDAVGVAFMGELFFFARSLGGSSDELLRTDGTDAGTVVVRDGFINSIPIELSVVGNELLFNGSTASSGRELWKSDGTSAGTTRVRDILSGSGDSNPAELTPFAGSLYFRVGNAQNPPGPQELWKSDGTHAGTVSVKNISVNSNAGVTGMTEYAGELFFSAYHDVTKRELWKSDGSEAGTVLVKDIAPGSGYSYPGCWNTSPSCGEVSLVPAAGFLMFVATSPTLGKSLWRTDGTEAGTVAVGNAAQPYRLAAFRDLLLFGADDGYWRSDGTDAGTELITGAMRPAL
ncbi:MAG: hypothetical protein JRI23_11800 [Deltaproteobacteria bacterium]|jgi:ELWxxDGT repeat protein|nr:hypothetical protein [Deltaproteobacteria bacterium]MBW2532391.1 hypothetical protein [Deltaproteobacteria bacterium]